jgi:uncharacterized protein
MNMNEKHVNLGLTSHMVLPLNESSMSDQHISLSSSVQNRLRMLLLDSIGNQWYVFDPESTNILLVSNEVAAVLRSFQDGQGVQSEFLEAVFEKLELSLDYDQSEESDNIFGIALHLNHACNLACEYCYADGRTSDSDGTAKGAYGGPVTFMNPLVLETATEKFMHDVSTPKIVVILWGGEPLLSENRFLEAVKVINAKSKKFGKQVVYQMTTNGTKFTNAILNCLKDNDFRLVVSIDGKKETHDQQRPMANGEGSYSQVMQGLERLSSQEIPFAVRGTAFRGRPNFEQNHYALAETPAISASIQFHSYGEDAIRPLGGQESDDLFNHYREVASKILEGDSTASRLDAVRDVLSGLVFKEKRQFKCGAGRWYFAVSCSG